MTVESVLYTFVSSLVALFPLVNPIGNALIMHGSLHTGWTTGGVMEMIVKAKEEGRIRNLGIIAIKSLTHRHWKDDTERQQSGFPKSWCKPVDTDRDMALAMATLRFSLAMGSDVLIPPGNFKNFTFFVDHIDKLLSQSLTAEESALLDKECTTIRDYPFFG